MIDLQQYKTERLKKFNQLILLDLEGKVVQSCNAIFDTADYITKSIKGHIPLLESIFDTILEHELGKPDILFSKIENPSKHLQGFYDFTFSKVMVNNQSYILWSIYDFTALYLDLISYQQRYNELEIQKQLNDSLTRLHREERKNSTYFESMISALKDKNIESNQVFSPNKSINAVFEAFRYHSNIKFLPFETILENLLFGDVTWFKFFLYNLIDRVSSIYKKASVQLKIDADTVKEFTHLKLEFKFIGKTANINLFMMLFEKKPINKTDLTAPEQALLAQLYGVKKIINENSGSFKFDFIKNQDFIDMTILQLQSTLTFNFKFKVA